MFCLLKLKKNQAPIFFDWLSSVNLMNDNNIATVLFSTRKRQKIAVKQLTRPIHPVYQSRLSPPCPGSPGSEAAYQTDTSCLPVEIVSPLSSRDCLPLVQVRQAVKQLTRPIHPVYQSRLSPPCPGSPGSEAAYQTDTSCLPVEIVSPCPGSPGSEAAYQTDTSCLPVEIVSPCPGSPGSEVAYQTDTSCLPVEIVSPCPGSPGSEAAYQTDTSCLPVEIVSPLSRFARQ
ncbi:hypothetical protein RRG08_067008 [Elysia crispata]|uniref:Uncharacterized protein n=1 Tax=Elysia crispata TaxID=231223 RepID=A0AAE0Z7N9_9GAST|nr:hypothetical protein RRG08_067008 [Elysia crispata]